MAFNAKRELQVKALTAAWEQAQTLEDRLYKCVDTLDGIRYGSDKITDAWRALSDAWLAQRQIAAELGEQVKAAETETE